MFSHMKASFARQCASGTLENVVPETWCYLNRQFCRFVCGRNKTFIWISCDLCFFGLIVDSACEGNFTRGLEGRYLDSEGSGVLVETCIACQNIDETATTLTLKKILIAILAIGLLYTNNFRLDYRRASRVCDFIHPAPVVLGSSKLEKNT